ncbi:transposase [Actinoplanes sp. ATCC 53533]|uniref:transposase n=1 Tax=Actinoplanes sp. ATCC 53533 TaxID=1288362 RepID=UPI000F7B1356|nr:transposase [Actinoplanes sp. ATCC 53533]RSM65216.1 transposase [Actinoplanes sp. ATCC 53533]
MAENSSPGEEDDAVALVRVFCGLASADETVRTASAGSQLTIAVVDDAGRLLGVHEISDDPGGYAQLGTLLVERTSGFADAAVAADSDDHMVTSLLTAAGRPLAVADDDSADDFAERFADDDSSEEISATPAARRAVGLARALQAGALTAAAIPAPRELVSYKPVLAAHVAMLNGRHSAATSLREVLRELYPAALRAYPDPAHPLALAVLDALPEPGRLTGRGNDSGQVAEDVAAELTRAGAGTDDQVVAAVTALVVAISESPRRGGINKSLSSAAADTVRHAIGAVRSCDSACEALVGTLIARVSPQSLSGSPGRRQAGSRRATESAAAAQRSAETGTRMTRPGETGTRLPRPADTGTRMPRPADTGTRMRPSDTGTRLRPADTGTRLGRRNRPEPAAASHAPAMPRPMTSPPVAPEPMMPPPLAPRPVTPPPVAPAAASGLPGRTPDSGLPSRNPGPGLPGRNSGPGLPSRNGDQGLPSRNGDLGLPSRNGDQGLPSRNGDQGLPSRNGDSGPASRPVSVPPPPPGMTPIVPGSRPSSVPPVDSGQPFRPTLTNAAMSSARAERQRTVIPPRANTRNPQPATNGATDYSLPMPAQRSTQETPEPGSRANWPLMNSTDDAGAPPPAAAVSSPPADGRVRPPWQDMPKEPPALRLVESQLSGLANIPADVTAITEPPPLRLVDDRGGRNGRAAARRTTLTALDRSTTPPVPAEGDGDLLIFAAARSAWFTGHDEEASTNLDWTNPSDTGWRAAEKAATPSVAAETSAGLPKRVPQANLVPGSPLREERPLRIVRDAASIAAHTTGYFRGWRRGQEIGGYAIGGRPGREAAGGWDFSRDGGAQQEDYRNAGYRSS